MTVTMTMKTRPSGYIAGVLRPMVKRNMTPKVQRAVTAVKAAAPVDKQGGGGRLKSSIVMRARDGGGRFTSQDPQNPAVCSYEVAVQVPYASHVIHGTRAHPIASRGPWPLRNRKTGQVFGPRVMHPGTRPNDFVTRGMKASGF